MRRQGGRSLADGTIKTWAYTYDYENRLIKAEKDSDGTVVKTVTFTYDPFGRRVGKKLERTKNGVPVTKEYTYVYDNEDIILETFTKVKNGNTTTKITKYIHVPGINEPLRMDKDGTPYYYHADGLGSITHLTDANQAVVESYTYNVFGKQTRYGDTVKNRYAFTAREWDREVGLYYYRNRYYDPRVGRFITKDPIGFNGGDVNLYGYVWNNPVNWRDPNGLLVFPGPTGLIGGGMVGAFGGAIAGAITGAEGGIVGAIGGAIGGGSAGFVSGAVGGAITGTLGGGIIGSAVGGIVGTTIGELLSPTPLDPSDRPLRPSPLPLGDYPLPPGNTLPC